MKLRIFLITIAVLLCSSVGYGQDSPLDGQHPSKTFAQLGTPDNGSNYYCSDCQATSPCTSGGTGAAASRVAGAWNCSTGGSGGVASTRTINTTSPLTGGGDLSIDRTFACPTCGVTGTGLNQFASTTSAQLRGVLSDENGTGAALFDGATSPGFGGTPTAPTAAVDTNTTQIASTAYVIGQGYLKSATAASTYQTILTNSAGLRAALSDESGTGVAVFQGGSLGAGSATSLDTALINPAGNVLEQRNGTSAQNLRIYNTFTDISNYARFYVDTAGGAVIMGSQKAGTGSAMRVDLISTGDINFRATSNLKIQDANGATNYWSVSNGSGHFLPGADSTYKMGDATHRPSETWAVKVCYATNVCDFSGAGSPESSVTASVGSTYRRTDGGAGTTFYIKESGSATNTGWVAK